MQDIYAWDQMTLYNLVYCHTQPATSIVPQNNIYISPFYTSTTTSQNFEHSRVIVYFPKCHKSNIIYSQLIFMVISSPCGALINFDLLGICDGGDLEQRRTLRDLQEIQRHLLLSCKLAHPITLHMYYLFTHVLVYNIISMKV